MKICVIEYYNHRSDVEYLTKVLHVNHELLIIANSLICSRIAPQSILTLDITSLSAQSLIKVIHDEQPEIIIACTVTPDARKWMNIFELGIPVVALVHNVNWQLSPKLKWQSLTLNSLARRVKWWIRGDLATRLKLTKKFSGLIFPSPKIETYAQQFTKQPTLGIQWAITPSSSSPVKLTEDVYRITIPGGVDFMFRDYTIIVDALKRYTLDKRIHLNFLGAPTRSSDKSKLGRILKTLPKTVTYTTYESYVPTEAYKNHLEECHVLMVPHKGEVLYANQYEYGGISKVSGAENDQVRSQKPAIISSKYKGMLHLAPNQRYFSDSTNLLKLIESTFNESWSFQSDAHNMLPVQIKSWTKFLNQVVKDSKGDK